MYRKCLNCVFDYLYTFLPFRDLLLMQITKQKRELTMRAEAELAAELATQKQSLKKMREVGEDVNVNFYLS